MLEKKMPTTTIDFHSSGLNFMGTHTRIFFNGFRILEFTNYRPKTVVLTVVGNPCMQKANWSYTWVSGPNPWVVQGLGAHHIVLNLGILIHKILRIFSLFWFCNNQCRLNIRYIKTKHVSPDLVLSLGLVLQMLVIN